MRKDKPNIKGFTLIELVAAMIIVAVLSIISVPIYTRYVKRATLTEGKALVKTIASAERIYSAENGVFLAVAQKNNEPLLEFDARMNTYFRNFRVNVAGPAFTVITTGEAGTAAAGIDITLQYPPETITINGL